MGTLPLVQISKSSRPTPVNRATLLSRPVKMEQEPERQRPKSICAPTRQSRSENYSQWVLYCAACWLNSWAPRYLVPKIRSHGVVETRNDIPVFIQMGINGSRVDIHIGAACTFFEPSGAHTRLRLQIAAVALQQADCGNKGRSRPAWGRE